MSDTLIRSEGADLAPAKPEIEKKYLIRLPDVRALAAMPGARVYHLEQTYLLAPEGVNRRIRRIREGRRVTYVVTEKTPVSELTRAEREWEVSRRAYLRALTDADPACVTIRKVRYAVPCGKYLAEIDVYEGWKNKATLEIEVASEEEARNVTPPDFVTVLADVTTDKRYTNHALAKSGGKEPRDV